MMRARRLRCFAAPWNLLLMLIMLVAVSTEGKKQEADHLSFPYLYATKGNPRASEPVYDHIAPASKRELESQKPAFLYGQEEGYRIVMFYGHWCNTCKNFKPHFIHFAKRVQEIAKKQGESVDIYAISCHPNRKLCRKQKAAGFPLVRLLPPGRNKGVDLKHTEINPVRCLQRMGMTVDQTEEEENWDIADTGAIDDGSSMMQRAMEAVMGKPAYKVPYHRRTRDELKADIHLSFDFAMRDGVFSSDEPLKEEAIAALKDWLRLLFKVVPPSWEMHKLVNELIKDFNYISRHEAYLYAILDQFPPPSTVWSAACSHGEPDAGYTCGLWELFHTMTIGVVDYNNNVHEKRRIGTEVAARTLRNYIEQFFNCVECRSNFLKAYDSCELDRCHRLKLEAPGVAKDEVHAWAQLPLWLLETHNAVNVRLMKERAARENRTPTQDDEIDVLWPPQRDCLPCWNKDRKTGEVTENKTVIYKWLQLEYGQRDSDSTEVHKEVMSMHKAAWKREKMKRARVEVTQGSAAMAMVVVFLLGGKMRKRRVSGRHKKDEDFAQKTRRLVTSSKPHRSAY